MWHDVFSQEDIEQLSTEEKRKWDTATQLIKQKCGDDATLINPRFVKCNVCHVWKIVALPVVVEGVDYEVNITRANAETLFGPVVVEYDNEQEP